MFCFSDKDGIIRRCGVRGPFAKLSSMEAPSAVRTVGVCGNRSRWDLDSEASLLALRHKGTQQQIRQHTLGMSPASMMPAALEKLIMAE